MQFMQTVTWVAEGFMSLFQAGGETFMGWVTGIILIGEDRVTTFAQKLTGNVFGRYLILPIVSVLFLGNPMCYSFGRFVEEKYKPAYYDAAVSFVHPATGLFPHANPGELFVYMGIAAGITELGLSLGDLALRYFVVGMIVIFIRGMVTERIYLFMNQRAER